MPELINLTSHGNNITVILLKEENIIRKLTLNKESFIYIENEYRGINWYKSRGNIRETIQAAKYKFDNYMKLDMSLFKGNSVCYRASLRKTRPYVKSMIKHYFEVWSKEKYVPCHGDLTLSNIIFNKNFCPRIIDWEHFNEQGNIWGFDICYFVLSSLLLPNLRKTNFEKNELKIFASFWKELAEENIPKDLIYKPLTYLVNCFTTENSWKKIINQSPNKLYPLIYKKESIDLFESSIIGKILN